MTRCRPARDRTEGPAEDRYSICYVNGFQTQPDAQRFWRQRLMQVLGPWIDDGTAIGFDFAVSEQCARYDECGRYVDHFGDQVVMIEYRGRDFREACRDFGSTHAIVRRDLALSPSYEPRYC